MKFHGVHGSNVALDENGHRASRTSSFCDGITFSHKPISINSRISVLLGANEDWTGALRLGVTSQDPGIFNGKKLPRYACPELTSKNGYWAKPLPENWAANGNRLTFYVNSKGQFHLFVNSEHKGAILLGLPVNGQLWIILDLYGITVSVKFVANSGTAPTEVIARGPEAVQAYHTALSNGSTSYYYTRLALIGPPDGKKKTLKKLLVKSSESNNEEFEGIDATCICQTSEATGCEPWTLIAENACSDIHDDNNNHCKDNQENASSKTNADSSAEESMQTISGEEEFFRAIAVNIVREMVLQKKKNKEERRKTPLGKNAFRLQSSLTKMGSSTNKNLNKPDDSININRESQNPSNASNEMPTDLPKRVVEMVEMMLKECENSKLVLEKKENEKQISENTVITFNIWNYSGHPKHLFLHQLFLSPQTIYLFVFDLAQDLDAPIKDSEDYIGLELSPNQHLSYISFLHLWLEMIYISLAYPKDGDKNDTQENIINDIICPLFPPVVIVGVQEDSTTSDTLVEHQFNKIKESIQNKVYYHLVHPTFYYVGYPEVVAVDSMIQELRKKIIELALQLPHVGIEIPLKWILFKQALERLIEREVYFADISKLSEVARLEDIESEDEFNSMIHFFHHQGKLWYMGSDVLYKNDDTFGTVILKPQWFINYIYQMLSFNAYSLLKENYGTLNENLELEDIVTILNFEKLWPNAFHHITVLLSILDAVDVISEVTSSEALDYISLPNSKIYLIPWLTKPTDTKQEKNSESESLVLVLDFSGLLPIGFFTKFMVRLFRWSKRHNWKRNINTNNICSIDGIPVDYNHNIKLQKLSNHQIKVTFMKKRNMDNNDHISISTPSPHVCSKVRHLLERETEYLRDVWYKRLSYTINTPCPCGKTCEKHNVPQCMEEECMHLLSLNECLSKKIIECDYRSVKTDFVQKFFFSASIEASPSYPPSLRLSMDSMNVPIIGNIFWGDNDIPTEEPHWVQHVAKMLTSANTGQDWIALAKRLGYNQREIHRFEDENVPAVILLNNWIDANGRTRYCIDLLIACLEQMGRRDVADRILIELGPEMPSPPVFISYQWDSQEAVLYLRRRIELAGYPCWMDVGHMGGGDTLYGKIYEGISRAKIILCCLTPRYVLSPLCTREMSLADVLRKPIVPIMLEPTPWPPPGALALILSSLIYIDLCGIGGHGGCGRQADWETRFCSIIERLSQHTSPSFSSHQLTSVSSERIMPPPSAAIIKNNDEYTEIRQDDESDIDNPDVPLPEDDVLSVATSTEDAENPTPTVWHQPQRNRVVRCSICNIL